MKKINSLLVIILFVVMGCGDADTDTIVNINNFDECVSVGTPIMEIYPEQCIYEGKTFVNDSASQTSELSSIYIISMDGSESWNENYSEDLIGCDDKLLEIVVGENLSPEEALEKLINFEDADVNSGEYNVFSYPDELSITEFSVENGVAIVKFSDELVTGGMCDSPRVPAQIWETLLQYPEIDEVEVYVGEESIDDYLSEKG